MEPTGMNVDENFLLDNLFVETLLILHHSVGTKCGLVNEHSAYLWHQRLGHISKERFEKIGVIVLYG
ncbi:hypothetical protein ACOSQ3_004534 [Xanthoceras sorbifolium]